MTSLTAVIAMFTVFLMVVFLQMSEAVPIRPDSDATSIVESQGPVEWYQVVEVPVPYSPVVQRSLRSSLARERNAFPYYKGLGRK
ncbi:hypothetical protein WR25_18509 [Diploscapter pachys]|uniref:Uncharacterized protein n=1 Tax=Diploscapter pachys TaxID=2018661 RepID=A0A2A2JEV7_9BILA|nr:hypothetical protein WR25_18509 [Diploscapter pachys]